MSSSTMQAAPALAADPNQKFWDLGLKCFNDGDVATTAIQKIWKVMPAPGNLNLCAAIVGALYADTYWDLTKMDKDALATDLQAALFLKPDPCKKAAAFAFSRWYGMLMRADSNDSGAVIPKSGGITASLDIVLNSKSTLTVDTLISLWNSSIWNIAPGLKNNGYGRAQSVNIQVIIPSATLSMFYSDAGFLPPPQQWTQAFANNEGSTGVVGVSGAETIPPGTKVANPVEFSFQFPGTGHYCAIGVVSTPFFANDPLSSSGNWNSQEWLRYNGAAAWHNTDVLTQRTATLKFYNQDGVSERFVFEAACNNVPAGTVVSLQCDDKRLAYPVKSNPVKVSRSHQVVATEVEVPPNFGGDLTLTVEGDPLPPEASIEVSQIWRIPPGHRHHRDAVIQLGAEFGDARSINENDPLRIAMGSFIYVGKPASK